MGMNENLVVFSVPLAARSAAFTEDQIEARCNKIQSELEILIPTLGKLRSSRLGHTITVRQGVMMVDFHLESSRQYSIPFQQSKRAKQATRMDGFWDDYQMIVKSLQETREHIGNIARDILHGNDLPAGADPDLALRKIMAKRKGTKMSIGSSAGQLDINFPEVPRAQVSAHPTRLTCGVVSVSERGLIANRVDLPELGQFRGKFSPSRQFLMEYPPHSDQASVAARALPRIFDRKQVTMSVHVCYDPLTEEIRYFSILELGE